MCSLLSNHLYCFSLYLNYLFRFIFQPPGVFLWSFFFQESNSHNICSESFQNNYPPSIMAVWLHIQFFVRKSHSFRSLQILKNSILEFTEKYGLTEISSLLFFFFFFWGNLGFFFFFRRGKIFKCIFEIQTFSPWMSEWTLNRVANLFLSIHIALGVTGFLPQLWNSAVVSWRQP